LKRWLLALVLAGLWLSSRVEAQGCSQCRETVGQTPPAVQAAYRRGIAALMVAGVLVCGSCFLVVRRFR
jgi:hypothetical protein